MHATKPAILLFDLGGVIVPWVGIEALQEITGLDQDAVLQKLKTSREFRDYEIGHCTDDMFLRAMIKLFDLQSSIQNFAALWNSWVKPPYPNTVATLQKLKGHHILACLSNTNHLHWEHLKTLINLHGLLDHTFASHQIHAAKPDMKSFEIPLQRINVPAVNVWFFDDTLDNVKAARKLGMTAFHVDKNVGVVPMLQQLDLV